jgi:hypothetical protein
VYDKAPIVRNELINRERLSTSVVGASKRFIDTLLDEPNAHDLGLEGNGPEVSIAHAILIEPELWKLRTGRWQLVNSSKDDPSRFRPVMNVISSSVKAAGRTDQPADSPFPKMLDEIGHAPYGTRRGLSMVLIWIHLIRNRTQIALYDNGTYVTDWSVQVYERFIKRPEFFSAVWFDRSNTAQSALREIAQAIPDAPKYDAHSSLSFAEVLRPLYAWFRRLPEYTKRTADISPEAVEFRRTMISAVDPVQLLHESIPKALLGSRYDFESTSSETLLAMVEPFRETVEELHQCYSVLVDWIVDRLATETDMGITLGQLRDALAELDDPIVERIKDPQSRSFFVRAKSTSLDDHAWVQSVASGLVSQAPQYWSDVHKAEFQERLAFAMVGLHDAENRAIHAEVSMDSRIRIVGRLSNGRIHAEEMTDADVIGETDSISDPILKILAEAGLQSRQAMVRALGGVIGGIMTTERAGSKEERLDD